MNRIAGQLRAFRNICLVALVASIVVALAVGKFLSVRSLRPVSDITSAARAISTDQLNRRLPTVGTGDELDQLTITLNELLARIERHITQLRRFTADAAHELRTPLTALRGSAELALLRLRSPEELRRTIEDSIVQYQRLQRVAQDLLVLARLDAHEAVLQKEQLSLGVIVSDVAALYGPIAEDKGLELVLEKPSSLAILGDSGRLRQMIGNLIDNAIKYTPAPGRVSVSAARVNGSACLVVKDTGIGISAEDLTRVFDRFYRADPSRSDSAAPGSGLGLSICRSIVEAHGGTIEIASAPGDGTTVSVRVPLGSAARARRSRAD